MTAEEHKVDVLILSSAIGSGHMRASEALVRKVTLLDSDRTCTVVDFPHEVSPDIEHLLRSTYLESLKLWPTAYGKIYRSSESRTQLRSYQHYVYSLPTWTVPTSRAPSCVMRTSAAPTQRRLVLIAPGSPPLPSWSPPL